MVNTILIDKDLDSKSELVSALLLKNLSVTQFDNEYQAIKHVFTTATNLVLLSTNLEFDPIYFIKIVREFDKSIKIIVLATEDNSQKELEYLKLNISDYILSNKTVDLICERIISVININNLVQLNKRELVAFGEHMVVDLNHRTVKINDNLVSLSIIEFEILACFLENRNKIISRKDFLKKVWNLDEDQSFNDPRAVDVHIKNIRKKTGITSIRTIRGQGYQFIDDQHLH